MESITITRALAELKMLNDRIMKKVEATQFCDIYQNRKDMALKSHRPKKEFEDVLKANMESITDLMSRRERIKAAVVISNATTDVKIAGDTMKVAEAIERKQYVELEKFLLNKMRVDFAGLKNEVEAYRTRLDADVQKMVEQNLGSDKKIDKDTFANISKPFIEANEMKLFDPLNIGKKIEDLEKKIDEFTGEVDFTLSESNSRTEIRI